MSSEASLDGQAHHAQGLAPHVFNADIARVIDGGARQRERRVAARGDAAASSSLAALRRRDAGERAGEANGADMGEAPNDGSAEGGDQEDVEPFRDPRDSGGLLRAIRALRERWITRRAGRR